MAGRFLIDRHELPYDAMVPNASWLSPIDDEEGKAMLVNNIELDVKTKCIEGERTQAQIADNIGITPSYVNRIVKNKEQIVNKTFLAMMDKRTTRLIQSAA